MFVPSGGVRGYFFKYYYYREFVFFSGGVRGYLLITITIVNFVCFRVVCAVIFNHHYCCVFSGWRARLFLNYYYYHELRCFSGGVRGYFLINTMARFACFSGGVRCYF